MKNKGFTVIETVIVISILIILAAAVIIRWDFDPIKLEGAARKVVSDIRYTQKLAISSQARSAITFNANGYSVFTDITVPTSATSPGDTCSSDPAFNFVVDFTAGRCSNYSGVTLGFTTALIAFNSLGKPVDAAGTDLATQTVTVNYNGSKNITIEAGTGRVSY